MTPLPWLGIEIRHLVALSAVARTKSFRGAAEELGYVQSAISQQVAQLERLVGQRLVERSRGAKQVHLTRAGELLLEHVDEIVTRFRAAQADVAAVRDLAHTELRVGLFGGLASRLLAPLMRRFAREAAATRLVPVDTATDAALFAKVEDGTLDVAFVERPLIPGPFEHHKLLDDPWVLLVQAGSPLARSATRPGLDELARLPLITLSGSRSQARVLARLDELGLAPRTAASAETELTVQTFVRAGMGVAIVPRLAVDLTDPGIAAIDLGDLLPARTLELCWLRERKQVHGLRRLCTIASALTLELNEPVHGPTFAADRPLASIAA